MLKRIVNEARFQIELETTGPLLIRSGLASVHGPDMTPVRTWRNNDWQVYVPGSSLKGVTRSHAEKIVRSLNPAASCNPLDQKESCGGPLGKKELKPDAAYRDSCLICKLFGSTEFIGRVSIGDAYVAGPNMPKLEQRDGVGIDRLTGGPKEGAKFELEAVSPGAVFSSEVLLRNFEGWQLGLLLTVVQDIADGLVRLGGGRSRGFGSITARVPSISIYQFARQTPQDSPEIWGLGAFPGTDVYGTSTADKLVMHENVIWHQHGLRQLAELKGERVAEIREAALAALITRVDQWRN